jgi:hypothetical protein
MTWSAVEHAWIAQPEDVVQALSDEGFQEYKRVEARGRRDRGPAGGVWQGLDARTGAVASAIWVQGAMAPDARVFIEIDGKRLEGSE